MKRLGALGTMVWDRIHTRDSDEPVEGWELLPIVKVGANLRDRADEYLHSLGRIGSLDGVLTVPEANNEVEIFYGDRARRCETLKGGVPGWTWAELAPLARTCDALYVNFIAGWELDLPAAQEVRNNHRGPLYCDLHSLFLGVGRGGAREPRRLAAWRQWLRCFDLVQVNEDELYLIADAGEDPWQLAAEVVGGDTQALFVTLGERGAAWVAEYGFDGFAEARDPGSGATPAPRGSVPAPPVVGEPDPTGCGDVWGMVCFTSLLSGASLRVAAERANELASRSAGHRGASRLGRLLGEPTPPSEAPVRTT